MILYRKTIGIIKDLMFTEKEAFLKTMPEDIGYRCIQTKPTTASQTARFKIILYRKQNNTSDRDI